ncbi:probable multidrug resistance-associated protein lethal(2)03659 isoform X2 [Drosophila albomicans]|uniref:Probable multidrug resistance-associated protein lethal(2)03659 isoform X1 n=1 Tax=Drosophila albomicans TaxID=7291 RepID=A0A9C6T9K3_DROAB|nr:probable multidrug resistance-associated protein lethal(2)03659 isoform X1 [Drosophila albomicans]XP_051862487.1 probable multidrug resistance-associated protein lethal(2)03659 isoform X2 [Drosophila albomicans]
MQSFKADELSENPVERANCFSELMFCFAMPVLFKGREKTLEQTDLYRPLKKHKSDTLGDRLCAAWNEEVASRSAKNLQPRLLRVMIRVFGWNLFLTGFLLLLQEFLTKITQPICLFGIMAYFAGDDPNLTKAQLYAAGLIAGSVLTVFGGHPYMLGLLHLGMKMRVALCSLVYRKALRLSRTSLGDTTVGQVVNLLSNDVGRFDTVLINVHYLWVAPLELIVVTYFMYDQIGVSALFGVAVMLLFLPLQAYLGKKTSVLRLRTALRTDERVRMMNEIISGIQVIKMYAWEKPFGKLVELTRCNEMTCIKQVNYIRGILMSFAMFLSRIFTFVSLVGYVLLGNFLTAEKAFFVTAYYNILRRSVTMFFPQGISQFAELLVSIKRLQTFMHREETQVLDKSNGILESTPANSTDKEQVSPINNINGDVAKVADNDETLVQFTQFNAKWNAKMTDNNLDSINLQLGRRQLVAVIGPVGAGKSSLIQSILGELPADSGTVKVNGRFSYASQEPWLFTGTVRENILFGLTLDKHRYRTVVKKCALERDFELLPQGDKTIVGERGASLSGGQKARISLARAVYRRADIYLLDDPLSAVDTHVGRHLFDQCMRGYLRSELVILVTHQLQFLEQADLIVIMDKGKISAMGTYSSMKRSGLDFAQLLTNPNKEDETLDDNESEPGDIWDRLSLASRSRRGSKTSRQASRNESFTSLSSLADSAHEAAVTPQETRVEGKISLGLYKEYFTAGSSWLMISFMVFLCLGTQIVGSASDVFLSYWVDKNKNAASIDSDPVDIYYFTALNMAVIIFTLVRTLLFYKLAMRSSKKLHNSMFRGITNAAMYFFNTNPSGRILNRFSKDLGQIDELLPTVMLDVVQIFLTLTGIIVVICITNPYYLLLTLGLGVIFYYIREFYLKTSRDVKRLEAVARSPIYSHLSASLNGLPTIRALGAQKTLIAEFDNLQDLHSSGYYTFLSTNRAFGYYLDLFCSLYIVIIIINYFINPPENSGEVGLAITQAMGMTGMVQWGMRQSAELENTMTAVERVVEYDEIEPEGEYESKPNKKPPITWPEHGQIVADDLSLRYFPDPSSKYVLKSLNFEIKPMEKVGIVGRTGAGKSSLINALFRLSYNDGAIVIDSRDTNELGLHDLRSKISIIPQEPVLFSGSMRYNLDPFEEYSDVKLWDALEEVKLKPVISELPNGLQSIISEGGTNFSIGQRQLVCLARAILRENRILVMDEATANVDPQTDALIQATIRNKFRECTVLTIAHRLNTIMDSDKVLVMDAGQLVEFGSPYELLTQCDSKIFHSMVMETGQRNYEGLLHVAEKAHLESQKTKRT